MSRTEVRDDERAAVDAIGVVVDVAHCERLEPPGHIKTPDWRVTLACGRVADVEVTTRTDGDALSFSDALTNKDGSPKVFGDERLSHTWAVMVFDHNPGTNKRRRPVKELPRELGTTLARVEAVGGTPEQMVSRAQEAFDHPTLFVSRPSPMSVVVSERPGLQLHDNGRRSQRVCVVDVPELVGHGNGAVETHAAVVGSGAGCQQLVSAVQHCIDEKTKKRQMDRAPDRKWLAVMLDGLPGFQLRHHFSPGSRVLRTRLEGISFDYFDEVWAITCTAENCVVLRLSEGGSSQQHYIVSRA